MYFSWSCDKTSATMLLLNAHFWVLLWICALLHLFFCFLKSKVLMTQINFYNIVFFITTSSTFPWYHPNFRIPSLSRYSSNSQFSLIASLSIAGIEIDCISINWSTEQSAYHQKNYQWKLHPVHYFKAMQSLVELEFQKVVQKVSL